MAKNDPIAFSCRDGDYSSPLQRPKIGKRQGWIKTIHWFALAGDGNHLFFPTAKTQNRQAARVDKNDPIAFLSGDGLSVLSLPQKVQGLRKNISRKKRTPSDKNKPKTAAPGGGRVFGGGAGGPQARRRSRRGERSSPARLRRAACGPYPGCCRNFSTEQGKFVQNHHHFILP